VSSPLFWLRPFDWNSSRFVHPIPIFALRLPFMLSSPPWTASLRLHELDALLSASDVVSDLTASFAR
jgi:hypothetical protein